MAGETVDMGKAAVDTLIGMGFPGMVIGALAYAVWKLNGQKDALQETRVKENAAVVGALEQNTASMNKSADAFDRLTDALKTK